MAGRHDGLLAIGGGSPIDTAKAMSILAAGGEEMRSYKVPASADRRAVPVVCVPTTAGTGSEVTRFCVITDPATDEKMLIAGLGALPSAAIIDYELTLSMPMRLTADTGIDALTHAIEAFVSKRANSMSDLYALSAMKILWANLRIVCAEPGNHAAREAMMWGATQAGLAFSNASVALVHGMSRPIGAFFHVPHGLSNAMLLPVVTAFSADAGRERYAICARQMGLASPEEGDQLAVARLIEALTQVNIDLEVPSPARYGIPRERYFALLETMADQALASGSPGNNPRVPTREEIMALYRAAYD
ncbi:iron-containing alcohol dehydrogenase [Lacibacterium aquatile]|uniref:Iron-containing alcohol dehydrogenase n=1 Tax=Lacibacterium aquatile TaxID=1168082 RepID=A0ABW5DNR6_9PROT